MGRVRPPVTKYGRTRTLSSYRADGDSRAGPMPGSASAVGPGDARYGAIMRGSGSRSDSSMFIAARSSSRQGLASLGDKGGREQGARPFDKDGDLIPDESYVAVGFGEHPNAATIGDRGYE